MPLGRKRAEPGGAPTRQTEVARVPAPDFPVGEGTLPLDDDEDAERELDARSADSGEDAVPALDARSADSEEEGEEASTESGFDSEEIEQWDDEADAKYADAEADEDVAEGDAALARMVARARVKPDEGERRTNKLGIDTAVAARFF